MTSRDLTVYSSQNIWTVFCSILLFLLGFLILLHVSLSPHLIHAPQVKREKKRFPVDFIISLAEQMLYILWVEICFFGFFLVECCPIYDSNLSHGPSVHTVLNASGHTLFKLPWRLISLHCFIKAPGRSETINCVFLVTLMYNLVKSCLSIIHYSFKLKTLQFFITVLVTV